MPRRKVYGKRSQAVCEPFAALVSPLRKTASPICDVPVVVAEVAEEMSRLDVQERGCRGAGRGSGREALRDRDANAAGRSVEIRGPTVTKSERRTRARRKIINQEESAVEGGDDRAAFENEQAFEQQHSDGGGDVGGEQSPLDERRCRSDDGADIVDQHRLGGTGTRQTRKKLNTSSPRSPASNPPSACVSPSTPLVPDVYDEHCQDLLSLCAHPKASFSDWSSQLSAHFTITKIAEASFGEVYRLSLIEDLSEFSSADESVFKIIALRPPEDTLPTATRKLAVARKKAEAMSKPADVANEVKLLQRMSSIPGFTNFRDARLVQGRPPPAFVRAFKDFNASQRAKGKEQSVFPDPGRKTSYADDQLWAVIEMQDAGTDLERSVEAGACTPVWAVWDIFWQIVLCLAKGEEGAEFEHRDLHLGNVCVRQKQPRFDEPSSSSATTTTTHEIDISRKLNFTGLETTVIDYTISRARMPDGTVAHQDLSPQPELFEGDGSKEYQYDIYRYMRGALLLDDPYADFSRAETRRDAEHRGRTWVEYRPVTNLIWLHFILYGLLEQVAWPSAIKAPPARRKDEHARWKRANDLERVLLEIQDLLDPGSICGSEIVGSATDLVGLALEESWLDVADVVGDGGGHAGEESELVRQLESLELQQDPVSEAAESEAESEPVRKPVRSRRKP